MHSIDWIASFVNIGEALIVTAITSFIAILFTKKYFKHITFANKMKKYGFSTSVTTNDISSREYKMMFEKASSIRIMYVSGYRFFKNPEMVRYIKRALQRGAKIQFLLARKDNVFLKDIVNLEVAAGNRAGGTAIDEEADYVHEVLGRIREEVSGGSLEVRYFSSEYRLPMTIAEFSDGPSAYALSWLNITLPPYKSQKKFLLRGREDFSADDVDEGNLVLMMIKHFDSVWEMSKPWEETAPVYWRNKYAQALESDGGAEEGRRVLIQASAQHPLKDGQYPGAEFEGRLRLSAELYRGLRAEGKEVKIYVPGSRHETADGRDQLPLSEAGKTFLLRQGIPQEDVLGDEMNQRYKGRAGVYDSADECYVSSRIFKDGAFDTLYCVCGPLQTVKDTLFFIENGIMPRIYAVPCGRQFHTPYFESAVVLPDILHYDHSWQGNDSFFGNKSRRERVPRDE